MPRFSLLLIFALAIPALAQEGEVSHVPPGVGAEDFAALKGQSPFLRSLNLSDSLILTGLATVNQEQVATLLNKDTKETFVVSSTLNSQGWRMVELKSDPDLEKVAAKVAIEGGEVVTVRYADWQLKPGESKPGAGPSADPNPRPDSSRRRGEGERRGPPSEFREKMSRLSEDQRREIFREMSALREKQPDLSREERGRIMTGMMDKMLQKR
ncbi:MAG: hypothetical protein GXX91_05940 [Verrucomicrobiaceae bacterium]|nr:hypothetical protein [Verrucomicrobiaceae bacterium]